LTSCWPGLKQSGTGFDLPAKRAELTRIEEQTARLNFWDNPEQARKIISQMTSLKSIVEPADQLGKDSKDLAELFVLAETEGDKQIIEQIEKTLEGC
jgi:peptide chain release factor 2